MPISFNQIPVNVLTPGSYVEIDASRGISGLPRPRNRTVLIAQKLAAGTAAANTLVRIDTAAQAKTLFGVGSMAAKMVEKYKLNDPYRELWVSPLADNGAGVAATGTILFSGTVAAAGVLPLYIAGQKLTIAIALAQATAAVATAVAAAINAATDLPVTATAAASTVTLTARHKGTNGNGIDVRTAYYPEDVTATGLVATVTPMASGATNPDVTAAFTAIGDEAFATVLHPYNDATNLAAIEAALAARADGMVMNDGLAVTAGVGSQGTHTALGAARNSQFSVIAGVKNCPTPAYEIAAALAGQEAFSNDNDPGRPSTTLVLKGVLAPTISERFGRQERQYLLESGISTCEVDAGGNLVIERLVTTYKTNPQGYADTSMQDLTSMRLLFFLRWSLASRVSTKYPRHKLGNDGGNYGTGSAVVTPNTIKAEAISLFR